MKTAEQREFDFAEGLKRKARGIRKRNQRDEFFYSMAMVAIEGLALRGRPFTSDDLRVALGANGPLTDEVTPTHVNGYGAVIHAAAVKGIIHRIGYAQSERKEAHGRVVAVYIGTG